MEQIRVAHAILFSDKKDMCFLEKNLRFEKKLTLFWGKLDPNESYLAAIQRELFEETGIHFSSSEIHTLIENDILFLGEKQFLGRIFVIFPTRHQIEKILAYSERNIMLATDEESLWKADFAFVDLREKILTAKNFSKK